VLYLGGDDVHDAASFKGIRDVGREIDCVYNLLKNNVNATSRAFRSCGHAIARAFTSRRSWTSWPSCWMRVVRTTRPGTAEDQVMQPAERAPVWLLEEQALVALLHAALDRFDHLPAQQRQRDVLLMVEQHLPLLARADAEADQVWALIGELQRQGVLTIRYARRGVFDPDWKSAKLAFGAAGEAILRRWLQREAVTPELQRWRMAVAQHQQQFPGGAEPLLARRIVFEGRSSDFFAAAFARIASVHGPLTLRQVSARVFWGDSKFLDGRGELITLLFPALEIRERAIVVAVHLPSQIEGVLFIENQDTYTQACSGQPREVAKLALVFASGFRGSAQRVRQRDGALLHYSGCDSGGDVDLRRRFEAWWFERALLPGPCSFWGDLDFAGMQILKALRGRFGSVAAWPPGYEPMLTALRSHGGYSPLSARARAQADPLITGCDYADRTLLPAIREFGQLDQEFSRT
jgi:hypothetical protein